MRSCFLIILVMTVAGFISCGTRSGSEKPVLSQMQMVPIVYDLMLADEYSVQRKAKDSNLEIKSIRAEQYEQIFKINNTNRKDFLSSLKYYQGRPDEFKVVFDTIDARANRLRIKLMVPGIDGPAEKKIS